MKWEYRMESLSWPEAREEDLFIRKVDRARVEALLNEKGAEGWEVVAAFDVAIRVAGTTSELGFIMKRPL